MMYHKNANIEQVYNGIKFRSRLEARWAIFFDSINLKYEYEPEGFKFDGYRYVPDFYFPETKTFAEVKPNGFFSEQYMKKDWWNNNTKIILEIT